MKVIQAICRLIAAGGVLALFALTGLCESDSITLAQYLLFGAAAMGTATLAALVARACEVREPRDGI